MKHISISKYLIFLLSFSCSESEETTYWTVSVQKVNGGIIEYFPQKDKYEDGEIVSFKATPNSDKKFLRWVGYSISTENPIQITLKNNISISAEFEAIPKKYLPDISGKWTADKYTILLELTQENILSSNVTGTATIYSSNIDSFIYTVSGRNYGNNVSLNWARPKYVTITCNLSWQDSTYLKGSFEEAGKLYYTNFYRYKGKPNYRFLADRHAAEFFKF